MGKKFIAFGLALVATFQVNCAYSEVSVKDAWMRATTPTQTAGGAFMSISSSNGLTLVGASSPLAGRLEFHEMRDDHGIMRMRRIEQISIPANTVTQLAPNAFHVMLMDIKQQLLEGSSVPLTLTLVDANGFRVDIPVNVKVVPVSTRVPHEHQHREW